MAVEIKVPALGESVTEATVSKWMVKVGDSVTVDQPLCELETDKVTVEVPATTAGTIADLAVAEGATVQVGGVLCHIEAGGAGARAEAWPAAAPAAGRAAAGSRRPLRLPAPAPAAACRPPRRPSISPPRARRCASSPRRRASPPPPSSPRGKDGRATKADVMAALSSIPAQPAAPAAKPAVPAGPRPRAEREERVRMTRLRRTIANRLKEAQNTAAMLTTFNEVDMTNVMALRERLKEDFEKKHGARLGFMSFFVKACIAGLKELPAVNAEIEGDDLVYKNYYDIGVAVGTPQRPGGAGAARRRQRSTSPSVEKGIGELGRKARDGKLVDRRPDRRHLHHLQRRRLRLADVDADPQPAAVGHPRHAQDPAAADGGRRRDQGAADDVPRRVSYDHRIIDGREAVLFLVRVKECIEDPERLLLGV